MYHNNFNNNLQKNDSDFISNFDQNQTNSFDENLEASKMIIKNPYLEFELQKIIIYNNPIAHNLNFDLK